MSNRLTLSPDMLYSLLNFDNSNELESLIKFAILIHEDFKISKIVSKFDIYIYIYNLFKNTHL